MSRQVRFFIVNDDLQELLAFAEQLGCRAVPQIIDSNNEPDAYPPTKYTSQSEGFFYLLPGGFAVVEAFYHEMTKYAPGRSKLIAHTSPVIEVCPGRVDSSDPVEGRIYHCQISSDPRYRKTLQTYNKLKKFIVDNWPKTTDGRFYFGRHAARLRRSGETRVTYGGEVLELESE